MKEAKEKPPCRVAGCDQRARGFRGFGVCSMHYQRIWQHGNLFGAERMLAPRWSGSVRKDGYRIGTINGKRKLEHIRIAEKALGKELPKGVEVHHVNLDRSDNRPQNLVICQDAKYHALLHIRTNAVNDGFPPHYRKCSICKQYDDPANMYVKPSGNHQRHRECQNAARRKAA